MKDIELFTGDCLSWGKELPDDSIDLLFTSPPYLSARTYGRTDVARGLDAWVAWMMEVVAVFAPKVKGLMAINCEGQTRNYQYLPAPFLLMADLHRAGFNLRKPCVYERDGVPGSGGPDWLKNRWEPIICITRPGKLPWSDPCIMGRPPVCSIGGAMSNRTKSGSRINEKVPRMREAANQEALSGRSVGDESRLQSQEVLRAGLSRGCPSGQQQGLPGRCQGADTGSEDNHQDRLQEMRGEEESARSSSEREPEGQQRDEQNRSLFVMPSEGTSEEPALFRVRGQVSMPSDVRPSLQTMEKSSEKGKRTRAITRRNATGVRSGASRAVPDIANPGNIIDCGADTHFGIGNENEAPFPMKLADFFVKSFCPPGGVACDPFCGSGTLVESAVTHGRKFVGGDIRESQIALTRRRLSGVTPATLFHEPLTTGVPA